MRTLFSNMASGVNRASILGRALFVAMGLLCQTAFADGSDGKAAPAPAVEAASTQAALLEGVRAFRAERYAEALELFRRVEATQKTEDIGFYLGMALHKLGRHAEALTAFRRAHRGGLREPIADYYQAVSCYRLGLLLRARHDFSAMLLGQGQSAAAEPTLGPRLQQGAQRFLQSIEQALAPADPVAADPLLRRRYELSRQRIETLLATAGGEDEALEWLDEAVQAFLKIKDRAEYLPSLQRLVLRLREPLHGKPAELDLLELWKLASGGSPL